MSMLQPWRPPGDDRKHIDGAALLSPTAGRSALNFATARDNPLPVLPQPPSPSYDSPRGMSGGPVPNLAGFRLHRNASRFSRTLSDSRPSVPSRARFWSILPDSVEQRPS
ncbi:hypothetical protein GSI_14253 [Ganoderma sinense ZZ0214-1]|uniref:Uncharacterized protein n=1 Tax=Ganoderma sinense ZZ0214-1 TaxID=1077348 RepID=A0A2G8RT26_9APHY|nr:hypothetical protein GSI_14253 [Ganoderma sinense ZZ0214-1]